ncbi:trypsin-like peptidase domain-containing protein [Magnetococcus sp. PR-3]|uniref:trypsin-like peptidase domain-containing protein n=1 Tax=Magnetococcus sp. PR-3 TaxID=3120355 RepID=UPI002FCE40CA
MTPEQDPSCGKHYLKYLYMVWVGSFLLMLGSYWWIDYQAKQEMALAKANGSAVQQPAQNRGPNSTGQGLVNPGTQGGGNAAALPVALNQPLMAPGGGELSIPQNVTGPAPFARVAKFMMPSVVNVSATTMRPGDPNKKTKTGLQFANPFSGMATESIGSGVVVTEDGYILSNFHVVENAKQVFVTLFNDQGTVKLPAEIVTLDSRRDLALLKVEADNPLQPAPLGDSKLVNVGDPAIAIGSPFGLDQTVSQGIISGKRKAVNIGGTVHRNLLQTDAAINRGNSGGPLVGADGSVIGVNTAIYTTTSAFSGVGFAVPSNAAREFLEERIQLPNVTPINGTMMPVAAQNAPPIPSDAVLTHDDRGPCENCHQILPPAGGGQPVAARPPPPIPSDAVMPHGDRGPCENCHQILPAGGTGQPIAMQRGPGMGQGMGQHRNRADRMFSFDPNGAFALPAAATTMKESPTLAPAELVAMVTSGVGATFQVLNVDLAAKLGSPYPKGLVVDQVKAGSSAEQAGLKKGDVLIKANGKWLESLESLAELIQAGNQEIRLSVVRDGRREELLIGVARLQAGPGAQMQPVAMNQQAGMPLAQMGNNLQQPMAPSMPPPMAPSAQGQNWNGAMQGGGMQNGATPAWQTNGTAPRANRAAPKPVPTEFEWMGMEIIPITSARMNRQPMLKGKSGGLITDMGAASPAMRAGVQRNDVVVAINGQAVSDGRSIDKAIKAAKGRQWALLEIERNGTRMFVKVQ